MRNYAMSVAVIASSALTQLAGADVVMSFDLATGGSATSPLIETNTPLNIDSTNKLINATTAQILAGEDVQFCAYFEGFCSSPSGTPFGIDKVTLGPHTNPEACIMCFEKVVLEQAKDAGLV